MTSVTYGQITWSNTYSARECNSIIQNDDETLVFTEGSQTLIKTDKHGEPIWSKKINIKNIIRRTLLKSSDGGYLLYGTHGLIKTDSLGNLEYVKEYNEPQVVNVIPRSDGFVVIEHNLDNMQTEDNTFRFYSLSTTFDSTFLFSYTGDFYNPFENTVVVNDIDGGFTMCYQIFPNSETGIQLVKWNSNNELVWDKFHPVLFYDGNMTHSTDNGYFLAWSKDYYDSYTGFNLTKFDSNGNLLWTKNYGASNNTVYSIANIFNVDNQRILISYTYSELVGYFFESDFGMSILGEDGNLITNKYFDAGKNDGCFTSLYCNDGGYVLGGKSNSFWPYDDIAFIIKTDSLGNSLITSKKQNGDKSSRNFTLLQNYPNPFNPSTTIKYSIPTVETGHAPSVRLIVYDILGREVETLVNEKQKPGNYEVVFNASNLPSGIYFYSMTVGKFNSVKKMMLVK